MSDTELVPVTMLKRMRDAMDQKLKEKHYSSRSEYIRELIRKDLRGHYDV